MTGIFQRRSSREKALILCFLFAAAVVWLVAAGNRLQERWRESRVAAADLEAQDVVLGQRAAIEQRATAAARSLDPTKTLDATRLAGEVSAIASRLGLTVAVEPPRTERTGQLAYHTVQVSFRRADLASLVKYYRELNQRAPYLALEKCVLGANASNPAEIDAVFS
ncbi:MAG TPA: hypothetical protein VG734_13435, partial [Lacunisphaera sp.]|nr:hypothetical protein [Lacunisphaera sp.]